MDDEIINLLMIIDCKKRDDIQNIVELWIEKKNLSSPSDINNFIKSLTHFVTRLNNHDDFKKLYTLTKTLSNNSGILEIFIPLCCNDLEFANEFINYYNKQNELLINKCLNNANNKNDNFKNLLSKKIGEIGPIYIFEVNNLINLLKTNVSLSNIYKLYEQFNKENNFFKDIIDNLNHEFIRNILFKEYIFYKNIPKQDISEFTSLYIGEIVKDQILQLLKAGISFQDILELTKVKPWDYDLVVKPILNYIALYDNVKGKELKKYFEENYFEKEEKQKIKIYVSDIK